MEFCINPNAPFCTIFHIVFIILFCYIIVRQRDAKYNPELHHEVYNSPSGDVFQHEDHPTHKSVPLMG